MILAPSHAQKKETKVTRPTQTTTNGRLLGEMASFADTKPDNDPSSRNSPRHAVVGAPGRMCILFIRLRLVRRLFHLLDVPRPGNDGGTESSGVSSDPVAVRTRKHVRVATVGHVYHDHAHGASVLDS